MVHCDIKLENVFMTSNAVESAHVVLGDFELSLALGGGHGGASVMMGGGSSVMSSVSVSGRVGETQRGTMGYMAPELVKAQGGCTLESDMYSFGVLLRKAMQGVPMEECRGTQELIHALLSDNPKQRPSAAQCLLHESFSLDAARKEATQRLDRELERVAVEQRRLASDRANLNADRARHAQATHKSAAEADALRKREQSIWKAQEAFDRDTERLRQQEEQLKEAAKKLVVRRSTHVNTSQ